MPHSLSNTETELFITHLQERFKMHKHRHENIDWTTIETKLREQPDKLWSLYQMEQTHGEPDVVGFDKKTGKHLFFDCSKESPKGRRSLCYDQKALETRKKHKPKNSATEVAKSMGIELLTKEQYQTLQQLESFDTKTSSWLKTPENIRILGGAIFGDFRFDTMFIYHNGAESYYAARGFRGCLMV